MRRIGDHSIQLIGLTVWCLFLWKGYELHRPLSQTQANPQLPQTGCLYASQKATLPHGTANRAMPVNWRVSPEDIAGGPRADGRYIRCAVSVGDPVTEEDLQAAPRIAPAEGKMTYSYPLKPNSPADRSLNAGTLVQIFEEKGPALVTGARVLAVVCDDGCFAILDVTFAESQLLLREGSARLRAIPRE